MATLTLNSSSAGTGSWVLLQSGSCGSAAQTQAGLDGAGAAAYSKGSLALAANTNGNYTVRRLAHSQAYTVCATNGSDTASASFSTQAMAVFNNPAWQVVGTAGFSAGGADYQSLAFAPDGTPYVAYQDRGNGRKTTVMRFDGTAWQVVGTAGFSAGGADYQSLAFAPDGTPYVAYSDSGNGVRTTVMRFDGATWEAVGTAGFSAGGASYQSLAFAPDGTPYVAYQDVGNTSMTTVMRWNGTAWQVVGTAGFSAFDAFYQSLAFAPDGTPYVAYTDNGNGSKTTVMRFDGTAWQTVGTAGFSADAADYQSLAFAPDGTPYVAYKDYGNSSKTTVMRLIGTASAPTGLAAVAGNGAVTLSWTAPASNGGSAIQSYTVTGTPVGGGATVSCPATAPATTCTVPGLTNGLAYTFTVTATNAAGTSSASTSATATPQWSQSGMTLPGGGSADVQVGAPPGCTIANAQFGTTVPAGAPAGASTPRGVLSFTASGAGCDNATLSVRINYPAGSLSGLQPYKFGPASAGAAPTWFPHGVVVGDSVTYSVTDNGVGDNDTQLGSIVDPFAPLLLAAGPSGAVSIPTMSEWG